MKKLIIYGKTGCLYCTKAKEYAAKLVEKNTIDSFEYLDMITDNWTKHQIAERFDLSISQIYTVPQIGLEVDGDVKYIGGYSDLEASMQ